MNTRRIGAGYEVAAEEYLKLRGATPVARNYRAGGAEIDLIVTMDGKLVFVEVKQRSTTAHGTPGAAVTIAKQRQICRCSQWYLKSHKEFACMGARYDVVEILDGEIRHIKNAFPFRPWSAGSYAR